MSLYQDSKQRTLENKVIVLYSSTVTKDLYFLLGHINEVNVKIKIIGLLQVERHLCPFGIHPSSLVILLPLEFYYYFVCLSSVGFKV